MRWDARPAAPDRQRHTTRSVLTHVWDTAGSGAETRTLKGALMQLGWEDRTAGVSKTSTDNTPIRLTPTVLAFLAEAYVVDSIIGTNWEGAGVVPEVVSPAGTVIETAVAALR